MTLFEVATRMKLAGDGKYWHVMKDGTVVGLSSSKSKELAAVLRQVKKSSVRPSPSVGWLNGLIEVVFAAIVVVSSTEVYSHVNARPSLFGITSELSSWIFILGGRSFVC